MNKYTIYIAITSILGYSCSSDLKSYEEKGASSAIQIDIPNVKDSIFIRYSDLYQSVKYVALGDNKSSIIGDIKQLEITNNGDFIVFDKKNKTIARFDSTGIYKNLIGVRGHSKKEYIDPLSIAYDKYEEQIIVWDNAKKRLLFYSLDGEYLHSIPLNSWIKHLYVLDENHFVFFFDYTPYGGGWNYIIAKKDGSYCATFEDISNIERLNVNPDCSHVFSQTGDTLYCRSPYSSIIYKVNSNKVSEKYHLLTDGDNWRLGKPKDINTSITKGNAHIVESIFEVGNQFFFNISIDGYVYLYATDFKKNSFAGLIAINDIDSFQGSTSIVQAKKNKVYLILDSTSFENQYDKRKDDINTTYEQKMFLKEMSKNINPIIQICTLK